VSDEGQHWSLDKRIPIALLLGLAGSTLGIGATAVVAHHRLGSVERHLERIEARNDVVSRDTITRDRQVTETLSDLRATTAALREAVADLRLTLRAAREGER
jgi:hypothetical protein